MKDDLEFNIRFLKLIEQYKVLYDYNIEGSSDRITQEQAWREIAKELGENWMTCKEKWKNIRSCYTRHLRQKANDTAKKPYYLSRYLQFVQPFCRITTQDNVSPPPSSSPSPHTTFWGKVETTEDELTEDPLKMDSRPDEPEGNHIYFTVHNDDSESTATKETARTDMEEPAPLQSATLPTKKWKTRKRRLIFPSEKPFPESSALKRNKFHPETEDPDLSFFKSLLPDMRQMTNRQKNSLKIKILSEIERILYSEELEN